MTFDQFLRILRARWLLVALVTMSVAALVAVISMLLPKKYTAMATVMADMRPDPVSALSSAVGMPGTYLATQIDIIKSPHVAQNVVRLFKIGDSPEMLQKWKADTQGKGDYIAWLGDTIGKGLDIKPSRESNVIEITYEGIEPNFSAAMANAFAQAYIDTTVRVRTDPAKRYEEFFEERVKLARQKLEKAQERLTAAQRERGIVATDARLDYENGRLNDLASQITAVRAIKAESGSRTHETLRNPDQNADVLANSLVTTLKGDLARQEASLKQLNERYGDAHPTVIEAKANIDELKRRIREETTRVTTSVKLSNDVNGSREAQLSAAFEDQRMRVLKLNEQRNELQLLEREVEVAQKTYDSLQNRLTQTSLESNSAQSDIYLLSSATVPAHHSSPRVFINTFVAGGLGFLLALIVAMVVELFDRRVRGPFDLVQTLDLPVLGVLPDKTGTAVGLLGRLKAKRQPKIKHKAGGDGSLALSH